MADVAAVVVREDDDEDKLVVFVPGYSATTEQIGEEIAFQEQHFRTRIVRLP